jgi:hypothetical protein
MFFVGAVPNDIDYNNKSLYPLIFENVYRLQKFSEGYYTYRSHSISILEFKDAEGKKIEPGLARYQSLNSFIEKNITKIIVDPIGFIKIPENN